MPLPSTSVAVRCHDCGALLATFHGVSLEARFAKQAQIQARAMLEWHLRWSRNCAAGTPRLSEVDDVPPPPRGRPAHRRSGRGP